jgi:hypothetical protein
MFKGQINLSVLQYFSVENVQATLTASAATLAALLAAFAPLDYTTITAYQVVMRAFAIGYAADSAFNPSVSKNTLYGE